MLFVRRCRALTSAPSPGSTAARDFCCPGPLLPVFFRLSGTLTGRDQVWSVWISPEFLEHLTCASGLSGSPRPLCFRSDLMRLVCAWTQAGLFCLWFSQWPLPSPCPLLSLFLLGAPAVRLFLLGGGCARPSGPWAAVALQANARCPLPSGSPDTWVREGGDRVPGTPRLLHWSLAAGPG